MCRRKKKVNNAPLSAEEVLDAFRLKKQEPVYDKEGNRDYFTEYYNSYKNNYIDQYLDAYHKFKASGQLPEYSPYDDRPKGSSDELPDEIDV